MAALAHEADGRPDALRMPIAPGTATAGRAEPAAHFAGASAARSRSFHQRSRIRLR
jgi:hypothetical protein